MKRNLGETERTPTWGVMAAVCNSILGPPHRLDLPVSLQRSISPNLDRNSPHPGSPIHGPVQAGLQSLVVRPRHLFGPAVHPGPFSSGRKEGFMTISKLARSIAESPTMRLNEQARRLRERGEAVIHLGIGEPKNKAPIQAILTSAATLIGRARK